MSKRHFYAKKKNITTKVKHRNLNCSQGDEHVLVCICEIKDPLWVGRTVFKGLKRSKTHDKTTLPPTREALIH